jgi:hypothetical protein
MVVMAVHNGHLTTSEPHDLSFEPSEAHGWCQNMQRAVLNSASGSLSPKRSFEAFPQISRESYVTRRQEQEKEQETKERTHPRNNSWNVQVDVIRKRPSQEVMTGRISSRTWRKTTGTTAMGCGNDCSQIGRRSSPSINDVEARM